MDERTLWAVGERQSSDSALLERERGRAISWSCKVRLCVCARMSMPCL